MLDRTVLKSLSKRLDKFIQDNIEIEEPVFHLLRNKEKLIKNKGPA